MLQLALSFVSVFHPPAVEINSSQRDHPRSPQGKPGRTRIKLSSYCSHSLTRVLYYCMPGNLICSTSVLDFDVRIADFMCTIQEISIPLSLFYLQISF